MGTSSSENQKLIQAVKLALTERFRQIAVRLRHARQDAEIGQAKVELLIDDWIQEGGDLNDPASREVLYQTIAAKLKLNVQKRQRAEEREMEGDLMQGWEDM